MRRNNQYRYRRRYSYSFLAMILFSACAQADIYLFGGLGGSQTGAEWDIQSSATYVNPFATNGLTPGTITLPYESQATEGLVDGVGQAGLGFRIKFWDKVYIGLESAILANASDQILENDATVSDSYTAPSSGQPTAIISAAMQSMTKVTVKDPDVIVDLKIATTVNSPYSIIYFKGGVVFNELQLDSTTSYFYSNPSFNPSVNDSSTVSGTETKNVVGLHLGAGVEHLLNRFLAVYIEYAYFDYGEISLSTVTSTTSTGFNIGVPPVDVFDADGLKTDASADVSKHVGTLGFVFYFGAQY